MVRNRVICGLEAGIHARTAVELYGMIRAYEGAFYLEHDGKRCNLTSMIEVMKLNVKMGDPVEIIIDGPLEKEIMEEVEAYIRRG